MFPFNMAEHSFIFFNLQEKKYELRQVPHVANVLPCKGQEQVNMVVSKFSW